MQKNEYKNIFVNEEKHFYYRVNHDILLSLIKKYVRFTKNHCRPVILDASCGTGLLAKKISAFAHIVGIDISEHAIAYAQKRGITASRASIEHIPFKGNSFDAVVSMDVLYHRRVKNDAHALSEMYRVLKPKGILVLRVPAHAWLFSNHDRIVHTKRRYNINELRRKLEISGFSIKQVTYVNSVLFLLAIFRLALEKFHRTSPPKSTIMTLPAWINDLLYVLVSKIHLPFGLGLVAVAQKK